MDLLGQPNTVLATLTFFHAGLILLAGNHCWCGAEPDLRSAAARAKDRPLAECEATPCHANKDQKCGGTDRLL